MNNEIQKKIKNRLNRAEGQIRGISSMVDKGKYYTDIITQISAVKSALMSVENILIENHLNKSMGNNHHINNETKIEIMNIFNKRK